MNNKNKGSTIRKRNKKLVVVNMCLALLVFAMTYWQLSPDAITMENPTSESENDEVICRVWYANEEQSTLEPSVELNTEESTEISTEISTDPLVEQVVETPEPPQEEAASVKTFTRMLVQPRAISHDLKDYIDIDDPATPEDEDGLKFYVKKDNKWVESNTFEHGDTMKVSIKYTVDAQEGDNITKLTYDFPKGVAIKLSKKQTGDAMFDGVKVGSYTIDTNGSIEVIFNDKFDTTKDFKGEIEFQGKVAASSGHEHQDIVFDEENLTFDYKDPEPDKDSDVDIGVDKKAESNTDKGFDYTITVSSEEGTSGEVNIHDSFQIGKIGDGKLDATYVDENSFKVTKTLDNGTVVNIDSELYSLTVDNDSTPSKFDLTGLPPLGEGQSYNIKYSATPDSGDDGADGGKIVQNTVNVDSGNSKDDDTVTKVVKEPIVNKKGTYDSDNKTVTWQVTIHPQGTDLDGYTIEDEIQVTPVNDAILQATEVKITYKNGNKTETKQINLPYTFDKDKIPTSLSEYIITYTTDLSELPAGKKFELDNNVILDKGDTHYTDEDKIPGIYNSRYDFDKKLVDDEEIVDGIKPYNWQTKIEIPQNDVSSMLVYKDYIKTTLVNHNGDDIEDAHYTTVQALRDMTIKVGGTPVDSSNYTITYNILNGADVVKLDDTTDGTIEVETFIIRFNKAYVNNNNNKTIYLDYHTYINTNALDENAQYFIQNSAWVDEKTVEVETTYGEDTSKRLEKESKSPEDGTYTTELVEYAYDDLYDPALGYAVITYRAKLDAGKYTLDELKEFTLTDTLPDTLPVGTTLVTEDKDTDGTQGAVKFYFAKNDGSGDKNFRYTYEGIEMQHIATNYLEYDITINDDNQQVVTFSFRDNPNNPKQNFFANYEALKAAAADPETQPIQPLCFYIEYKIKLPDKSSWKDDYMKQFMNKLEFAGDNAENIVKVTNNEKFISKTGAQEEGSENIDYSIIVNPEGKDMNTTTINPDKIVLTDTLKFIGSNKSIAILDPESFKVYNYTEGVTDYKDEIPLAESQYSYTKEKVVEDGSVSYIFNLTIPDNTPLVVEYTYDIDTSKDNSTNLKVENKVQITGGDGYKDDIDVEIKEPEAGVVLYQPTLKIYKYDKTNANNALKGAMFTIDIYDESKVTFNKVSYFGDDEALTTVSNGMIVVGLADVAYEKNKLYRYTETKAPEEYELDANPRYFVFVGEESMDTDETEYFNSLSKPEYVNKNDVTFIKTNTIQFDVANEKIKEYALPSTGGANTIPYMLGVALFMAATIIYITLTRREGKEYEN